MNLMQHKRPQKRTFTACGGSRQLFSRLNLEDSTKTGVRGLGAYSHVWRWIRKCLGCGRVRTRVGQVPNPPHQEVEKTQGDSENECDLNSRRPGKGRRGGGACAGHECVDGVREWLFELTRGG